jgi:hypothetical protein
MKNKKNSPYLWIIFGLLIIIATILVLPIVSKEGKAIAPTISETPEIYLMIGKYNIVNSNYKYYIQTTSIPHVTNYNECLIRHTDEFTSGTNFYYNTGENNISGLTSYKKIDTNTPYTGAQIIINSNSKYFNLNPNHNYVADYNYLNIDLNTKIANFRGLLENKAEPYLSLGFNLFNAETDELINSLHFIVPEEPGFTFDNERNINELFNNLTSGTYTIQFVVQAVLNKNTLGPGTNYTFISNGIYSETFDYNGKTVSNIKATPSEDVEKFIEEEIVKKQIDMLTQGKK